MIASENLWYEIKNKDEVYSPSLLIYPERMKTNIQRMIAMAGDVTRLRPHVKTHKMAEITRMQMDYGITKFKCATIAETEMVARCGGKDILLAIQPAGPNIERFFKLKEGFRNSHISCIADSEKIIYQLSHMAVRHNTVASLWLDINNGMNRTGIIPGEYAGRLVRKITEMPGLAFAGLHVYDGHIHESDSLKRHQISNDAFLKVNDFIDDLKSAGFVNFKVIAGGTPTFPVHILRNDVECSPGTVILWDYGYSSSFSDMDFLHAAVLFNRIISKPVKDLICIDLGYKAVAAEMAQPRVRFLGFDNYSIVGQSEEHMVIKTDIAERFEVGDIIYSLPVHICPTVDRFDKVSVVYNNLVKEQWEVVARKRQINY
jgi:D-serine deaminase-like pyridoxal phosphate-dependent protein